MGISDAAEVIGFRTRAVRMPYDQLSEVPLPAIAHWRQNHFIVVYGIKDGRVQVADPAHGNIDYSEEEFKAGWISTVVREQHKGVMLLLEPTPAFYENVPGSEKTSLKFVFAYLRPFRYYLFQLVLAVLIASCLQLILPFLTQALVDFGVQNQDIGFVYTILIAQLLLTIGQASVDFIRSWILLHIGARISISFISDFLIKLMRLPLSYFDTKMTADLLQRIDDNSRIESFLTSSVLIVVSALVNIVVFGFVLAIYSFQIFITFAIGSLLSTAWVCTLLKRRKEIDYKRFSEVSQNHNKLLQIIQGMPEIKLNCCEKQKRWEWEQVQTRLFRVSIKGLMLDQSQRGGSLFIDTIKNIVISFFSAKLVIDGHMTLGMMMSVQFIVGQLNGPVGQMIGFFRSLQDARISLERMGEIHCHADEELEGEKKLIVAPEDGSIYLKQVCFRYGGPSSVPVLKNLDLKIPEGKITAIVGTSGSGKTTLLKLLLKFYRVDEGEICVGDTNLGLLGAQFWRGRCGVVMQDGFMFSDTIANNIALGSEQVDLERLHHAARISNVDEYVRRLPLGYNTKVGSEGITLSQGQKQRLLIARAIYKDPKYLMFDEATSSLDANNERSIMEKLEEFFHGKTVIVIAHRLSTVKNADQIVVLEKGRIVEVGNHAELTQARGAYYNLVKNQLELGN